MTEGGGLGLSEILLGLGLAVFLLVAGRSWWELRQDRRISRGRAKSRRAAVQSGGTRAEPGLGGGGLEEPGSAAAQGLPASGLTQWAGASPAHSGPDVASDDRLDERFYLSFAVPSGLASEELHERLSSLGHLGNKPLLTSAPGEDGGFSLGLLLANRAGPMGLADYEAFVELLVRLVPGLSKLDVEERLLGFPEAYRRARDRAAEIEALDGQLALHLQAEAPSALRLSELADDLGLMPRGEGRYSRMDESGEVAFSLLRGEHGMALTLLMDFPRCLSPVRAFDDLLITARALAEAFHGQLVDDRGHPLSSDALQLVRGQVAAREASFEASGVRPGSALARRLFS